MSKFQDILNLLPYEKPFLFVDELVSLDENGVEGTYRFQKDEYFYQGHFKDHPVTPGVILTECMAQIGVVCLGIYLVKAPLGGLGAQRDIGDSLNSNDEKSPPAPKGGARKLSLDDISKKDNVPKAALGGVGDLKEKSKRFSDKAPQWQTANPKFYSQLSERAKWLRNNQTKHEKLLWEKLRRSALSGYRFRRQHLIGTFIVDFVCLQKRLVIEIDGNDHESQRQLQKDRLRDEELQDWGFLVLRFKNEEVESNLKAVLERIEIFLKSRKDFHEKYVVPDKVGSTLVNGPPASKGGEEIPSPEGKLNKENVPEAPLGGLGAQRDIGDSLNSNDEKSPPAPKGGARKLSLDDISKKDNVPKAALGGVGASTKQASQNPSHPEPVEGPAQPLALTESHITFLKPVYPGEQVRVVSKKKYFRLGKLKCAVEMYNEKGEKVCYGTLSGMIQG